MNTDRLRCRPSYCQMSVAIIFALLWASKCAAEKPEAIAIELEQLFRDNSRILNTHEERLSGSGADFLLAETTNAQFVCIAEPHNVSEVPKFVTALFDMLQQRRGYQVEEVEIIADVARLAKGSISGVWGLDRVLDSGDVKDYLLSNPGQPDPRREFLKLRAAWSEDNLARYSAERGSTAARSADQHREDGFKRGFRHYYELAKTKDDPDPRVIFRFGHVHMSRQAGRRFDSLGRYLNIQLINEPGQYWSLTDYPEYRPLAVVGDPHRWVLVDLRPARSPLRAGKLDASDELKKFVENYDAVLLLGGGSRGRRL